MVVFLGITGGTLEDGRRDVGVGTAAASKVTRSTAGGRRRRRSEWGKGVGWEQSQYFTQF